MLSTRHLTWEVCMAFFTVKNKTAFSSCFYTTVVCV